MSDCLWPHGLQLSKLPCPSPSPRACWNACPLCEWCHPTISSSVTPFSSGPQSFLYMYLHQWVGSWGQVPKVLELQLQHQSFQWLFRVGFLYDWLVWSHCCPGDSEESSPTPSSKASILWHLAFFLVQLSHPYVSTIKTVALTYGLCGQSDVSAF